MLDTPTLQRNTVSFGWSAVVQNRQQIFEFVSTGHDTPTQSERCWRCAAVGPPRQAIQQSNGKIVQLIGRADERLPAVAESETCAR